MEDNNLSDGGLSSSMGFMSNSIDFGSKMLNKNKMNMQSDFISKAKLS